jgi:thiamine biosynthesis lipoprotein
MRIDLGGIGKGYVSKLIAKFLLDNGAKKILVDVGGEIISIGKSFVVAIKNPFEDKILATIKTSKEPISISTSGDYERFIDKDNHHIIDTKEGKSNLYYSSMTIIKNSLDIDLLDAYATALFNTPNIKPLVNKLNISAITIDKDNTISLYHIDKLNIDKIEF